MVLRHNIENFLRNKSNLFILGIFLLAFIVRLYFFINTLNQPLWWDEAEYASMAKSILYGLPFDFNPQRPILFPLLISLFLWMGEDVTKFFIGFLPSLGVVILTYLLGKEFYDEKVGLISSFIMSVFWIVLFNGTRLHADVLGLFLSLLGIYLFWRGYVNRNSKRNLNFSLFFMALAFMIKVNTILAPLIILFYLIITEGFSFLKNRGLWKSSFWFVFPLIPYFIYNYFEFGTIFSFIRGYVDPNSLAIKFTSGPNWGIFNFLYVYTDLVFFILFIIGILFVLFNLVIGFDFLKKDNLKLKADLFSVLAIVLVMGYFIFIERWNAEPRWLVLMAPFMFFVIGRGILEFSKLFTKVDKKIVYSAFIVLLLIGGYSQLRYTANLIEEKAHSYEPVKMAGLWIKENSIKGDIVLSKSATQIPYYSERENIGLTPFTDDVKEEIKTIKPKFLVVSVFEQHSPELLQNVDEISNSLEAVNGYFMDAEGTQAALIVYRFKNYDF